MHEELNGHYEEQDATGDHKAGKRYPKYCQQLRAGYGKHEQKASGSRDRRLGHRRPFSPVHLLRERHEHRRDAYRVHDDKQRDSRPEQVSEKVGHGLHCITSIISCARKWRCSFLPVFSGSRFRCPSG